jgi:hypothetical protein
MKVIIADHDCTIQWDGVYYFALSNYPHISNWELKKLVIFIEYEKKHGRETEIVCENEELRQTVKNTLLHPELVSTAVLPDKLTECTYCIQKGCLTKLVCHTTSIEDAKSIFAGGMILSAVKARQKSGLELSQESRNAAGDPPDYFDYVMFTWGNCQAGDRLVMERMLGRSPNADDLSSGLSPGVRFFFLYDVVAAHPAFVFDGYHPAKIKDGIELKDNLLVCIIPRHQENEMNCYIPSYLGDKVFFVEHNHEDILHWTDKIYDFVISLSKQKSG